MDIEKVKENVRKMAAQNAPMEDIDGYIKAAGYTVDEIRLFKPLPQLAPREKARVYSPLEKAMYTGRAAAEGLTLGLGDVLAGATNIGANLSAKALRSMGIGGEGVTMLDKATGRIIKPQAGESGVKKQSIAELFKEGRRDFVNEQKNFAKEHPILNGLGEAAGGILPGAMGAAKFAGVKAINKFGKLGHSIASGVIGGGTYGFGAGLTENPDKFTPGQAVKGLIVGAGLGGGAGAGVYGMAKAGSKAGNFFFNRGGRAYNYLNNASGGILDESVKKAIPFVDMSNKKGLRIISGANLVDDEASEILNNYGNKRMQQHKVNSENMIDKVFGQKGYEATLKDVQTSGKAMYDQFYDRAMQKGVIKIDWDPDLLRFLKEVRNNKDIASAINKYPDNHMRVLDQIKQAIDARIEKLKAHEGGLGVANLEALKSRLLKQMDGQNQYYRIARQIFERGKTFERGAQKGRKIFENPYSDIAENYKNMGRNGERPDFEAMRRQAAKLKGKGTAERRLADIDTQELVYNSMTEAEREGYKAGAAEKMRSLAESSNAEYENIAQKLFSLNRIRKLKAAGIDVSAIEQAAQDEIRAAQNMRNLFRGSQTAERREDIGNMLTGPLSYLKQYASAKINQLAGIKPTDIARIATDPGYAAVMRLKAQAAKGEVPFLNISGGVGTPFGGVVGPLTKREKDIYRKHIRKNLLNEARGKTFYTKNGEGIKFNKAGIGKGLSSALTTDKLLMLDHAPQISSEAIPLPFTYTKDPYIKTMAAPVSIDGRKDIALITLEGQKNKPTFFHNINPIDYWVKRYSELKKGIPSKSRWYQGKETKTPRFAHPAKESGAIPKGINSITNNGQKIKPKFNFRDFAILLQRPLNLGYNGEIIFNNLKKREDN